VISKRSKPSRLKNQQKNRVESQVEKLLPNRAEKPLPKLPKKAPSSAAKGARKQNALSLKEVISKALTGGALDRKAILEAVKNLGYKFSTNNPLNSLTVSLYTHKGIHKNGKLYSLKAGADKAAPKKAAPKKAAPKKAAPKKAASKKAASKKAASKKAAS